VPASDLKVSHCQLIKNRIKSHSNEIIVVVKGFRFCRGSNFDHSHRNAMSPLTVCELPFTL